jgi:hypothetical protein
MQIKLLMMAMLLVWPFSSGKDFPMTADPSVPAASGTVHAQRNKENENTELDIKAKNLARPSSLNPPATIYVVWIRPAGGDAVKEGAIGVDKHLSGEVHVVTVSKSFDLFITPEQSSSVTIPSAMEVLRAHVDMQ